MRFSATDAASVSWIILTTTLIGLISWLGDIILYNSKSRTLRAVSDNLTHGIVGALSWLLVIVLSKKSIIPNLSGILLCLFISSIIDLDHFLLAKSWKLADASRLGSQRPILHCSLIPVFVSFISETSYRLFRHTKSGYYAWIIITGFLSHHIRDATRRGMWFGIFGSTPAIPYRIYLCIGMGLPYVIYCSMHPEFVKDGDRFSPIVFHSV